MILLILSNIYGVIDTSMIISRLIFAPHQHYDFIFVLVGLNLCSCSDSKSVIACLIKGYG